jgi:serine/threonine protein kinase
MAEIFLALQIGAEGFEKPVVLKRILPALAADPAFVRMLVDEAHIVSTLNHSNLVQVLDLGQAADQFFLVLEFVDGWSLEQVRRRANKARMKLPLPLALYIVSSLCRALDYVHRRARNGKSLGIVHRDVTPQNVLISGEGEVKLADFGIAKAVGKREQSTTGVIKGKFAYMSPEQAIGAELDARSDLFSVGTLLYILTTGKKPFDAPTDLEVLMQVRRARFEKPSTLVRDFNPDVERFLARALRSERSRRFQSAEQMAERLDKILVKLGQPTGPSALKRWLDTLSARDGVLPPGETRDAPVELPIGTMELSCAELELHDVAPSSAYDEDGPHEDFSNASTEFAFAKVAPVGQPSAATQRSREAATVVANAGYPDANVSDPEPEKHTITIVVPSGATVIGLIPGDDQVKLRHEGVAKETSDEEESAEPDAEQTRLNKPQFTGVERENYSDLALEFELVSPVSGASVLAPSERRSSDAVLFVVDDEAEQELSCSASLFPLPVVASSSSSRHLSIPQSAHQARSQQVPLAWPSTLYSRAQPRASTIEPKRARSVRARSRRRLWRFGVTILLSLGLFGGGLVAARPYLPREFVPAEFFDLVERWLEQMEHLPRALRSGGGLLDFRGTQDPAGER